ncbi:MAG: hypothetical protein MZV63_27055 [Marinilabiliales bacterium]|nr:hypothetical protein [Marinilabiliales bacterium]
MAQAVQQLSARRRGSRAAARAGSAVLVFRSPHTRGRHVAAEVERRVGLRVARAAGSPAWPRWHRSSGR